MVTIIHVNGSLCGGDFYLNRLAFPFRFLLKMARLERPISSSDGSLVIHDFYIQWLADHVRFLTSTARSRTLIVK